MIMSSVVIKIQLQEYTEHILSVLLRLTPEQMENHCLVICIKSLRWPYKSKQIIESVF